MKSGCVLNDGGHIIALSRNDAVKAAARMKDTTKNNKAFEKNIYIKGYTQDEQDRLALLWDDFFAMKQEKQEQRIKAAKDDYGARRQKRNDAAATASTTHAPQIGKAAETRQNTHTTTTTAQET